MELNEALESVKNNPNDAHGWVALGRELKRTGKVKEARESFERALYLDPSLEHVYEELLALEARDTLPPWLDRLQGGEGRSASPGSKLKLVLGGLLFLLVLGMVAGSVSFMASRLTPTADPTPLSSGQLPVNPLGQTRAEAVPLGESLLLEEGLSLQVLKSFPDASDFKIRYYVDTNADGEKDDFQEAIPTGMRPYVVRLLVENVSADDPEYLSLYGMGLSSAEGMTYDESCGVVPEGLEGSLPLGQKTEGNLCFLLPEGEETIEFLLYEPLVSSPRRFFRLTP